MRAVAPFALVLIGFVQSSIGSEAAAYLNAALDVMQQHHLHRDQIDWPALRRATMAQAAGAQVPVDTYPAIRFALAKLGDHHSFIDRDTGSSAEAIAIDFRARPETRFFGELTYGAATSTFPYPLSDGARIYLVTGIMLDRNGREYPDGVAPDQEILSEATISTIDPVIHAAATWLAGLPHCRASAGVTR